MIYKILFSKYGLFLGGVLLVVLGGWYFLNDWHYKPLKEKDELLSKMVKGFGECQYARDICEANLSKQSIEAYIEGLGEGNETINFDLSNLST